MNDFILRILLLSLASFAIVFASCTSISWMVWIQVRQKSRAWDDSSAKTLLLSIAAGPLLVAACTQALVILPALFRFEPRTSDETPGLALALLAGVAFLVLSTLTAKTFLAMIGNRRFNRVSKRGSLREGSMSGLPICIVPQPGPIVMLTGLWDPKLVVSRQVIDSLNDDELQAVVEHELAHKRNWDLAAHWLLRMTSIGGSGMNTAVLREWSLRAELKADRQAARASSGLSLASALVKIAAMPGRGSLPALVAANLVSTDEESILRLRVESLLQAPVMESQVHNNHRLLWFATATSLAVLLSLQEPVMRRIFELVELLAR